MAQQLHYLLPFLLLHAVLMQPQYWKMLKEIKYINFYLLADYNKRRDQHRCGLLLPASKNKRKTNKQKQNNVMVPAQIFIISWLDCIFIENFWRDTDKIHFHSKFYPVWQPWRCATWSRFKKSLPFGGKECINWWPQTTALFSIWCSIWLKSCSSKN